MVLAPADFYAYSRATGIPVPEDPEERADLVPDVLAFRRNQLQSPKQESNLLQTLGLAAAGIGLAGAAALGARRFLGAKPKQTKSYADIARSPVTAKLHEVAVTPSKVAPSSKIADPWGAPAAIPQATVDLTQIQQASAPAQRNQFVNAVESGEDQMTGRMRQQLQRNEDLDLASIDQAEDVEKRAQYLKFKQNLEPDAAINSVAAMTPDGVPFDQAEGLTSAQRFLTRERMEIASQLGEQNILITPSRVETELANRFGPKAYEYGPKYSARRQALELYAQTGAPALTETVTRFGLSPVTFETFENMPAAKRLGFESAAPFTTSYYPDEELVAHTSRSGTEIDVPGMGRVNIADIRKPVITEGSALTAEDYYQTQKSKALDWLGNLRVELEPKRNQILKERRAIVEQQANELIPQLNAAKATGQHEIAGDFDYQLQTLRTIWRNPELGSHREDELRLLNTRIANAQQKIAEDISQIQKKYPTTIENWSGEANRVFGELDVETGEFIPETMELRSERKMVDLPKGGGGRNVAEFTAGERLDEEMRAIQGGGRIRDYDPETGAAVSPWAGDRTQTGREIDIYGIRPSSELKADPALRPTEVQIPTAGLDNPYSRLDDETLGQLSMMGSEADQYNATKELTRRKLGTEQIKLGGMQSTQEPLVQLPTEAARRSVLMSRAIEKAAQLKANRNPRGGVLPDEITRLRRQMATIESPGAVVVGAGSSATYRPRFTPTPGSIPPQQLTLKGVTGFQSRQIKSPADLAAENLESYMSKLMSKTPRGQSTPLTSEVRIQPSLF